MQVCILHAKLKLIPVLSVVFTTVPQGKKFRQLFAEAGIGRMAKGLSPKDLESLGTVDVKNATIASFRRKLAAEQKLAKEEHGPEYQANSKVKSKEEYDDIVRKVLFCKHLHACVTSFIS